MARSPIVPPGDGRSLVSLDDPPRGRQDGRGQLAALPHGPGPDDRIAHDGARPNPRASPNPRAPHDGSLLDRGLRMDPGRPPLLKMRAIVALDRPEIAKRRVIDMPVKPLTALERGDVGITNDTAAFREEGKRPR